MTSLAELFENEGLSTSSFLREFQPQDISQTDGDALKSILKRQWESWREEPGELESKALKAWRAKRGYAFERLTFKLLALEGLAPWPPYYSHIKYEDAEEVSVGEEASPSRRGRRPGGEQIDGGFELDGRYFLLETKWQDRPMAASDMYAFRGRVDGKLTGTIGVIASATGFAEDAQYALLWGKEINVLLVDGEDMGLALDPGNSFRRMMRAKVREAARIGRVFYSYAEFLDKRGA
ncbi:MAG: hypothetical protein QM820_14055 [Minicystis sp.]